MIEALREYWYMALLLAGAVVLTCWVVSRALRAARSASRRREDELERLRYEREAELEFRELTAAGLGGAQSKRAFDGVALGIQRRLEKQPDMTAAFEKLTAAQRHIYALYYLIDDGKNGLSEFFKSNGAPLTPAALEAVRELFSPRAAAVFEKQYRAYDPDDEEVSLIPGEIERLDREYAEELEAFDIYGVCVEYIRKNITDFS